MDYRQTLNLPKTGFPMKANLVNREPAFYKQLLEKNIYDYIQKNTQNRPAFILHDGPPYANGKIHIGHALNKILKDVILKYYLMLGYKCPFIPGWDCHGLPVEHQLFKEINKTKHDVDIIDFRKKAFSFAKKFIELQKKDFQRLGILADWDNPYLTFQPEYEYHIISLLANLNRQGYIYRGRKPVNWCWHCETALAEAEVEYKEKKSPSIFCLFPILKSPVEFPSSTYFLIWTTTPWTLISNVAVAVHKQMVYGLYYDGEKHLVFAKELENNILQKSGKKLELKRTFKGSELKGIILNHPFLERESLLVFADFVSNQEGSGCVHIAPGHGEEDFSLTYQYQLPIIMPVNEKGEFDNQFPQFKGQNTYQASKTVIDILQQKNLLYCQEEIAHSYPHCWRCKQAIIFRATYQWFLKVDANQLREKILDSLSKVNWIPSNGIERMRAMVNLRPDWCLSRQRLWGVPIPALKCKNCQESFLNSSVIEKTAEIFRKLGSDSWFKEPIQTFLPENLICPNCSGNDFEKEYDILDVWFESGASFWAVVKSNPELQFPADMYLEGSDQHRGWFQVSLILSMALMGQPPFKTILTHGFVVDGEGKKMSKSLGNVISPQEVANKYGAEILRLWATATDYREDVRISESLLKQLADMYRKIRNTIKFLLGAIADFNIQNDIVPYPQLMFIDKYMCKKSKQIFQQVNKLYQNYQLHKVVQNIFQFCNIELSAFYLDILKDRLYTAPKNSLERKSAQSVLSYIARNLIEAIAPILSFTAQEAFSFAELWPQKEKTLFLHKFSWEYYPGLIENDDILETAERLLLLRQEVLKELEKARENDIIGSSLEAAIEIQTDNDYQLLENYKAILPELFIVSQVVIKNGEKQIKVKKALGQKCNRCWIYSQQIGQDKEYPDICPKCIKAIKEGKH